MVSEGSYPAPRRERAEAPHRTPAPPAPSGPSRRKPERELQRKEEVGWASIPRVSAAQYTTESTTLPQTATSYPLALLAGLALIAAGVLLRRRLS
jgi:LPXTG-motif cell wall-anchored protein